MKMPPKPKTAVEQLKAWGMKRLNKILWVSGLVAALSAGIVGGVRAWPLVEPYLFAHRGYVRDYSMLVSDKTNAAQAESRKVIRDLQVESAEGKRGTVLDRGDLGQVNLSFRTLAVWEARY